MMGNSLLQLLIHYRYPLIVPLSLVEGPIIMMVSGFFVKLGYFSFWPAYGLLMVGDLFGDIFWYGIGYFYGESFVKKFGKFFSVTEKDIGTVKKIFHRYHNHILVISKITMGFGFALVTLITAGLVRIPFKRYLILNIAGQFVWTGLLMAIGFSLGNFYLIAGNILGEISAMALFIIAFIMLIGFGKYLRARLSKEYSP